MARGYGSRCYPSETTEAGWVPRPGAFRKIPMSAWWFRARPRYKDKLVLDISRPGSQDLPAVIAVRQLLVIALALVGLVSGAAAQEPYPSQRVTIVVPSPEGRMDDLTARPLAAALERIFKQSVVVANRPGSAGAVGSQFVTVAKPDGYTLLLNVGSGWILPELDALSGRPPAYSRDQFVGIARISAEPPVLWVNAGAPWKSLEDLLEDARRRPGAITFASSGKYSASHMPVEMLRHAAGVKMRHLPMPGGREAASAVVGGQAHLWVSPLVNALPYLRKGEIRPLAVWGHSRLAMLLDVPTLNERGLDCEYHVWAGLFAPRGLPTAVLEGLRDAVRKGLEDPDFKTAMEKLGTRIAYQDGDEFTVWWARDTAALAASARRIVETE
jgi:tripartite-type tricarboxylate transporter receptor subunit TctC